MNPENAMLISAATVTERTRAYIEKNFLYTRPDFVIDDGESLLDHGIIDSMGVLELVEFLQEEFGVTISDEDITVDNLGSLASIARFIVERVSQLP